MSFKKNKITVNYPGLNLKHLSSIKINNNNESFDATFMAQLREPKGIYDLINIWKKVVKEIPSAQLRIIGSGNTELVNAFKTKIKEKSLNENIKLLGFLTDDEAFQTIKQSKIFIFPSHEEGFGLAPLEAQTLGIPIIAWDLDVFEEIFPEGMIKIKFRNIDKFANKVIELLKNKSIRVKLSQEAVNNSKRFDWKKTANFELSLIDKFIDEKD